MRSAQKAYLQNRSPNVLRAAIRLEKEVDTEVDRVRNLTNTNGSAPG